MDKMDTLYNALHDIMNEDERKMLIKCTYIDGCLYRFDDDIKRRNTSLSLRIKESKKAKVLDIISSVFTDYKILQETQYGLMIEIKENCHYVFIGFAIKSHIIIPVSFLEKYSFPDSKRGRVFYYIDGKTEKLKNQV